MSKRKEILERAKIIYRAPSGHEIVLKPIPVPTLTQLMATGDMPEPPTKEVKYAGGVVQHEKNFDDPEYQGQLTMWNTNYTARLLRGCMLKGIETVRGEDMSQDFVDEAKMIYGDNISQTFIKLLWYQEIIGNDVDQFVTMVTGQTQAVPGELQETIEKFRTDSDEGTVDGEDNEVSSEVELQGELDKRDGSEGSSEV